MTYVTGSSPELSVKLGNLLGMARTAEMAGNNEEALSYYNRVLEIDPRQHEAWIGKGKAAGWQSTIANVRTTETTVAFDHALANVPDSERNAIGAELATAMNGLVQAVYGMSLKHFRQFRTVGTVRHEHVTLSIMMLTALQNARRWDARAIEPLRSIIQICRDVIASGETGETAKQLRATLRSAEAELELLDPTPPGVKKRERRARIVGIVLAVLIALIALASMGK